MNSQWHPELTTWELGYPRSIAEKNRQVHVGVIQLQVSHRVQVLPSLERGFQPAHVDPDIREETLLDEVYLPKVVAAEPQLTSTIHIKYSTS